MTLRRVGCETSPEHVGLFACYEDAEHTSLACRAIRRRRLREEEQRKWQSLRSE